MVRVHVVVGHDERKQTEDGRRETTTSKAKDCCSYVAVRCNQTVMTRLVSVSEVHERELGARSRDSKRGEVERRDSRRSRRGVSSRT